MSAQILASPRIRTEIKMTVSQDKCPRKKGNDPGKLVMTKTTRVVGGNNLMA